MSVTSSVVRNIVQGIDRLVTEEHTDVDGVIHVLTYATALGTDTTAMLAVHKTQVEAQLAQAESEGIING